MATARLRTATTPRARGTPELVVAAGLALAAGAGLVLPRAVSHLPGAYANLLPLAFLALALALIAAVVRPTAVTVAAITLYAVVRVEPAPSDLLIVCLIAASLLGGRVRTRTPAGIILALLLFSATQVVSMVNAGDTARAVTYLAISLYLVAAAIWLTGVFDDAMVTRRAIKAYVIAAALSSALSVAALKLHLPGGAPLVYLDSRVQGLFKDPNVFGPFLVPAAAIVLEEIGRPRLLGWSTRRSLVVLSTIIAGVVFAFSRAAWLNLAIAALVVLALAVWRAGGYRAALRSTSALAACGLVGLALLAATGSLGFLSQRSKVEAYDTGRFANQALGFERATVHVFGYGPGQAERTLSLSTHSSYIRAVYEQGIPGLAVLVGLLLATLAIALRSAFADADLHGVGSAALLGAFLGLLANSAFVDTLHWRHFWLVAALIWASAGLGRSSPSRGTAAYPSG